MQNAKKHRIQTLSKGEIGKMDKSKIKIVKRTEAVTAKIKNRKVASPRVAAREMVANVTDWVADLKQRKSEETKAAFDLLFAVQRRSTES